MSLKDFDRKTYIADTARAFTARRIGKREFMRRMALAGVGFSGFAVDLPRPGRPFGGLTNVGTELAAAETPDDVKKWLSEVGGKFKGTTIRFTSRGDAADHRRQPDRQGRVHRRHRHQGRDRDRAARAGAAEGHARRAGPARHLRPLLPRPVLDGDLRPGHGRPAARSTSRKPELAMPGFDWDDFSKPLVDGISMYEGKMVGIPFDIPIFILMYRKDLLRQARHQGADHHGRVHGGGEGRRRGRARQRHLRHHRPAQVGPLLAELRLDRLAVGAGRLGLRQGQDVLRRRRGRHRRARLHAGAGQAHAARGQRPGPGTARASR